MKKISRTVWGIILIAVPLPLFALTLASYAIATFILTDVQLPMASSIGFVLTVVLRVVGLVSLVAIVPGFITGLVLILKKKK